MQTIERTVEHTTRVTEPGSLSPACTVDALRSIWEEQRDRVNDRICVIEGAITALSGDNLDAGLRVQAQRAAHMLAGSVGMFGFLGASEAAHNLERELEQPTPDRTPVLSALLSRIRSEVRGPVAL
jgi:chemotaxis protein histidine kinase CheA